MQIRVLYPIGMMIALSFLLMVGLPYQIGGGEMPGSVNGVAVTTTTVSATVTVEPLSLTVIAPGTRFVEPAQVGTSTRIATDARRAEITPVPLLTGLTRNKPSVWGSKGFYVLLGLIYVTLLGLFIKHIISISGGDGEQR
jgi:hypothetical protein